MTPPPPKTYSRREWIEKSEFYNLSEKEVLEKVLGVTKGNPSKAMVLLDLDSTLYYVGPRTLQIFREWVATGVAQKIKGGERLHTVDLGDLGYSVRDTFQKIGLSLEDEAVLNLAQEARNFWWDRFFNGSYLLHDQPYPGAVEFASHLYELGAHVVYLTGRSEKPLRESTEANLLRDGFPWKKERTHIYMRQSDLGSDAEHKATIVGQLSKTFAVTASFENEPHNLMTLYSALPKALHVFVDTVYSDLPALPGKGIYKISGFSSFQRPR